MSRERDLSAPITEPCCVGFARYWEAGRGKQITPIAASWEEGEERKTNSFWMSSHGGLAAGAGLMLGTPLSLSLSLSLSAIDYSVSHYAPLVSGLGLLFVAFARLSPLFSRDGYF